jgi:hypothetical protein
MAKAVKEKMSKMDARMEKKFSLYDSLQKAGAMSFGDCFYKEDMVEGKRMRSRLNFRDHEFLTLEVRRETTKEERKLKPHVPMTWEVSKKARYDKVEVVDGTVKFNE